MKVLRFLLKSAFFVASCSVFLLFCTLILENDVTRAIVEGASAVALTSVFYWWCKEKYKESKNVQD